MVLQAVLRMKQRTTGRQTDGKVKQKRLDTVIFDSHCFCISTIRSTIIICINKSIVDNSSMAAGLNMKGEPIPGEHWVEIDLQGLYYIDKVLIDWEVAYSNQWTMQVCVFDF